MVIGRCMDAGEKKKVLFLPRLWEKVGKGGREKGARLRDRQTKFHSQIDRRVCIAECFDGPAHSQMRSPWKWPIKELPFVDSVVMTLKITLLFSAVLLHPHRPQGCRHDTVFQHLLFPKDLWAGFSGAALSCVMALHMHLLYSQV